MDSLGNILIKKITGTTVLAKQVRASLVVAKATEIIQGLWGKKVSARAGFVRGPVLTVYVESPIMAQEIRFKQNTIIAEINKTFGPKTISKIRSLERHLVDLDEQMKSSR